MKTIVLTRTGERYKASKAGSLREYEGIRGTLLLPNGVRLYTVERGDGYKHMSPGRYECEHAEWTSASGRTRPALRVLGGESWNERLQSYRIYIHPANWPWHVTGCIAPGMYTTSKGVAQSALAMSELWASLGKYTPGRLCVLEIDLD